MPHCNHQPPPNSLHPRIITPLQQPPSRTPFNPFLTAHYNHQLSTKPPPLHIITPFSKDQSKNRKRRKQRSVKWDVYNTFILWVLFLINCCVLCMYLFKPCNSTSSPNQCLHTQRVRVNRFYSVIYFVWFGWVFSINVKDPSA